MEPLKNLLKMPKEQRDAENQGLKSEDQNTANTETEAAQTENAQTENAQTENAQTENAQTGTVETANAETETAEMETAETANAEMEAVQTENTNAQTETAETANVKTETAAQTAKAPTLSVIGMGRPKYVPEKKPLPPVHVGVRFQAGVCDEESVTWRILDVNEASVLVVSEEVLAKRRLNDDADIWKLGREYFLWEDAGINEWLNHDLYEELFADEERVNQEIAGPMFLLDVVQVKKYFSDKFDRCAQYHRDYFWWWVRSGEFKQNGGYYEAYYVDRDGTTGEKKSRPISVNNGGIRPAMWISYALAEELVSKKK